MSVESRLSRVLGSRYTHGALCVLSGFLLFAAFPPLGWHDAAWGAQFPLAAVAMHSAPRLAFRWGLLAGLACWLPTLSWLLRLHETGYPPVPLPLMALGWLALATYCALYPAAFALVVSAWIRRTGVGSGTRNVISCLLLAGVWAGLEAWRGWLFGGFPWNALGVSQYQNLAIAQSAELGGVSLVSALVALMNMSIAMTVARRIAAVRARERVVFHPELMIGLLACAVALVWGVKRMRTVVGEAAGHIPVRISAVQPNIPQDEKWDAEFEELILRRLYEQTELASFAAPDLVIWPETALPWLFDVDDSREFMNEVMRHGVPVLLGAMTEAQGSQTNRFYNSAILCRPGQQPERYHKQKLVLFGEYIPFAGLLQGVFGFDPLGWSCLTGSESTIFKVSVYAPAPGSGEEDAEPAGMEVPVSVLICFEDVFPALARRAAAAGARLLIVQTNDAWFDPTAASAQHMAHSVMRCIENRVPMVRAGNTGVTCAIDRAGRIKAMGPDGDLMVRRLASAPFVVQVPRADSRTTYARVYWISALFAGLAALGFGLAIRDTRANNATQPHAVSDERDQGTD